jgi:antitoxin component of RelBE/YafQ-DinJ toxin-antitoxin module
MESMMENTGKIEGTVENWESGALGQDPAHAKRAPRELEQAMDDAQGLQAISIRLTKELLEEYKFIAKQHGMGYQPLMRMALKRFAVSEFKRIAVQLANEKEADALDSGNPKPSPKERHAA